MKVIRYPRYRWSEKEIVYMGIHIVFEIKEGSTGCVPCYFYNKICTGVPCKGNEYCTVPQLNPGK